MSCMSCLLLICNLCFFSSRIRHTRCALVTGVQTCALPFSTAPQIELVISAVADPDASGTAYVELLLLNGGSASETMTLPPQIAAELTIHGGNGNITLERAPQTPEIGRAHV